MIYDAQLISIRWCIISHLLQNDSRNAAFRGMLEEVYNQARVLRARTSGVAWGTVEHANRADGAGSSVDDTIQTVGEETTHATLVAEHNYVDDLI